MYEAIYVPAPPEWSFFYKDPFVKDLKLSKSYYLQSPFLPKKCDPIEKKEMVLHHQQFA